MEGTFHISAGGGSFQVNQWGEGPIILVALHGFRQTGSAFAEMGASLPDHYTLFAPDLPYHGGTDWRQEEYHPEVLEDLITDLFHRATGKTLHLLGFSLGGQLASGLAIRRNLPVAKLILLAPDTPLTKWGWFTQSLPYPLRRAIAGFLRQPSGLLKWADWLHRRKMLDRFTLTFLQRTLSDSQRRRQLFGTWLARSHFPFSFRKIRSLPMKVRIILGEHDPLIPAGKLQRRFRGLPIHILEEGHDLPANQAFLEVFRNTTESP